MTEEITIALKNLGLKLPEDKDPCVRCGKIVRNDYSGFCMDCADEIGISEFSKNTPEQFEEKIKTDYTEEEWYGKTGKAWGPPPFFITTQPTGSGKTGGDK